MQRTCKLRPLTNACWLVPRHFENSNSLTVCGVHASEVDGLWRIHECGLFTLACMYVLFFVDLTRQLREYIKFNDEFRESLSLSLSILFLKQTIISWSVNQNQNLNRNPNKQYRQGLYTKWKSKKLGKIYINRSNAHALCYYIKNITITFQTRWQVQNN